MACGDDRGYCSGAWRPSVRPPIPTLTRSLTRPSPTDSSSSSTALFIQSVESFKYVDLRNSPGWWADSVATYCPSRPSQLAQKNITKHDKRLDENLCTLRCGGGTSRTKFVWVLKGIVETRKKGLGSSLLDQRNTAQEHFVVGHSKRTPTSPRWT